MSNAANAVPWPTPGSLLELAKQDPFDPSLPDRLAEYGLSPGETTKILYSAQAWAREHGVTPDDPSWLFPLLDLPIEDRLNAFQGLAESISGVDWQTLIERFCHVPARESAERARQMLERARRCAEIRLTAYRSMRARSIRPAPRLLCIAGRQRRTTRTHRMSRASCGRSDDADGGDGDGLASPAVATFPPLPSCHRRAPR